MKSENQNAVSIVEENDVDATINGLLEDVDKVHKYELMEFGASAQKSFNSKSTLLKTQLGNLLNSKNASTTIDKDLGNMQMALSKINVNKITRTGIVKKLFGEGNTSKRLMKMATKYQSREKLINTIGNRLHEGQNILHNDNSELRRIEGGLIDQKATLGKYVKMMRIIVDKLQEKLAERELDTDKKEEIGSMLNSILIKLQDFKVMHQATSQFIVSTHTIFENNHLLSKAVDRVCNTSMQLIHTSLSIQAALENQKKVMEATKATQEFTSDLLIQNADSLREATEQTNEIYSSPVLNIEKLKKAHQKMIDTISSTVDVTNEHRSRLLSTVKELDEMPQITMNDTKHLSEGTTNI